MPERSTASTGENVQPNVPTSERAAELSRATEPIGRLVQIDKQIAVNNERGDAIETEASELIRQSQEIADKLAKLEEETDRLDSANEKLYEEQARIAEEISKNALSRRSRRRTLQQGVQAPAAPAVRGAQQPQMPPAQTEPSDDLRQAEMAHSRGDSNFAETEILSKTLESQVSAASLSSSEQPQTIAERASFDSEDPITAIPHGLMRDVESVFEHKASLVDIRSEGLSRNALLAAARSAPKANAKPTIPPMPRK